MLLLSLYIILCHIELQQLTGVDKSFLIKHVFVPTHTYVHCKTKLVIYKSKFKKREI